MTTALIIRKPMPRKPPVKRLFSGLTGRPVDDPLEPTPVVAPEPVQGAITRRAIGPPLDEAPADPFADRAPLGPLKFTDTAEKLRKEKEAQRGRERRKLR